MTIAEKITRAKSDIDDSYNAGYAKGKAEGGDTQGAYEQGVADGIEQGKQAEYDAFWDIYQDYGNRTAYDLSNCPFAGKCWTDEIFKPKYPLKPKYASYMFRGTSITDLTRGDIDIDFSICLNMSYTFSYLSNPIKLPVIDISSATNCSYCFIDSKNTELSLILSEKTVLATSTFSGCKEFINLTISGVIACDIVLTPSTKLNKSSIESVMAALSTTTTGLTATFSKTAVNKAFATTTGGSNGSTSAEWLALVATRPNWTIALA